MSGTDAREALASVAAMEAAAARRAAWPLWLGVVVALAYGVQAAILTSHWAQLTRGLGVLATLAACVLIFGIQWLRGVKGGGGTGVRLMWANIINLVALFGPPMVRDHPLALDGAGPLILGGVDAVAILAAFVLIAWTERRRAGAGLGDWTRANRD